MKPRSTTKSCQGRCPDSPGVVSPPSPRRTGRRSFSAQDCRGSACLVFAGWPPTSQPRATGRCCRPGTGCLPYDLRRQLPGPVARLDQPLRRYTPSPCGHRGNHLGQGGTCVRHGREGANALPLLLLVLQLRVCVEFTREHDRQRPAQPQTRDPRTPKKKDTARETNSPTINDHQFAFIE